MVPTISASAGSNSLLVVDREFIDLSARRDRSSPLVAG